MNKTTVAAMHHSGGGGIYLSRTEPKFLSCAAHTLVVVLNELSWIPNLNLVNLKKYIFVGFLILSFKKDFFYLNMYFWIEILKVLLHKVFQGGTIRAGWPRNHSSIPTVTRDGFVLPGFKIDPGSNLVSWSEAKVNSSPGGMVSGVCIWPFTSA